MSKIHLAGITEMFPEERNRHVNYKNWTCTDVKCGQFNLEHPLK